MAASSGKTEIVRLLLEHGADLQHKDHVRPGEKGSDAWFILSCPDLDVGHLLGRLSAGRLYRSYACGSERSPGHS